MAIPTTRTRLHRSTRGFRMRALVVLAVLAGVLATTVARSDPASAWTAQRGPTEIVITSERLSDLTVKGTLILTIRRDGDVTLRVQDAHNTGATRKFFGGSVNLRIPGAGIELSLRVPLERIESDGWDSSQETKFFPVVLDNFDRIGDRAIEARLTFSATRIP